MKATTDEMDLLSKKTRNYFHLGIFIIFHMTAQYEFKIH